MAKAKNPRKVASGAATAKGVQLSKVGKKNKNKKRKKNKHERQKSDGTSTRTQLELEKKNKRNPNNFLVKPAFESNFNLQPLNSSSSAIVYIDGACWNNGKESAKAGYGVWWGDGHPLNTAAPLPGPVQSSCRAEWTAAIHAIEDALANECREIIIRSDSMVVVDTVARLIPIWKAKGWLNKRGEPLLDIDLVQRFDELSNMGVCRIHVEHVKAHSGEYGNECADRLATQGAMM